MLLSFLFCLCLCLLQGRGKGWSYPPEGGDKGSPPSPPSRGGEDLFFCFGFTISVPSLFPLPADDQWRSEGVNLHPVKSGWVKYAGKWLKPFKFLGMEYDGPTDTLRVHTRNGSRVEVPMNVRAYLTITPEPKLPNFRHGNWSLGSPPPVGESIGEAVNAIFEKWGNLPWGASEQLRP